MGKVYQVVICKPFTTLGTILPRNYGVYQVVICKPFTTFFLFCLFHHLVYQVVICEPFTTLAANSSYSPWCKR